MMIDRILHGHSGCRIELKDDSKGKVFVRKTSASVEYNSRLLLQAKKQKLFLDLNFKVPEILAEGTTSSGLNYFDMQYLPGLKLSELISNSLSSKILTEIEYLLYSISALTNEVIEPVSIKQKLDYLSLALREKPLASEAISYLQKYRWESVKIQNCHGDLTLENLIVTKDGLHMIDFQDVSIESFSQDISKLLFDLKFGWSNRYENNKMSLLNLHENRRKILRITERVSLNQKRGNFNEEVEAFEILNVLRVLPYVRDIESDKIVGEALISLFARLELK